MRELAENARRFACRLSDSHGYFACRMLVRIERGASSRAGMPSVPRAVMQAMDGARRREDRARRHHHSRKSQLRQPLPRLSRRRHRLARKRLEGSLDYAQPGEPGGAIRHRSLVVRDVRRLQRNRKTPGNAVPDERLRYRSPSRAALSGSRSTSYVPHDETKPYFEMAHEWVFSDRTFASQLDESFVAHQYLIAAQAHDSVNVPRAHGDAAAATTTSCSRSRPTERTVRIKPRASTIRRSATSSTPPGCRGASIRAPTRVRPADRRDCGRPTRRSATSATDPDWAKDVITPQDVLHHRRQTRHARGGDVDHAALRQLRSRRIAAAGTDRRGSRRSSMPSVKASFGTRPRSSCCGTIGAACTITFRRRFRDYDGLGLPRTDAGDLAVCQKATTSRTSSTRRPAS